MTKQSHIYKGNNMAPFKAYPLQAGDTLEPTDLYLASDDTWKKCPCPGAAIQEGNITQWVRPTKTS
jgi:hypothetical protein